MREEDRQLGSCLAVGVDRLKAVQQRRVEHDGCRARKQPRPRAASQVWPRPCRGPQRPRPTRSDWLAESAHGGSREAAVTRFLAGRRPSLRAWRARSATATLSTVTMLQLARAGAHRRMRPTSSAAPATSRLPAMMRIRPFVSLSPSTTGGSGKALQRRAGQRLSRLHRVPVIMSGSAVFGAPSASSGAPWFQTASFGTQSACRRRARSRSRRCRS